MVRPVKYYTNRQSNWRAFLYGLTFHIFPRDYPTADNESSWARVKLAVEIAEAVDGDVDF